MKLSRVKVEHIAELAKLGLTEEEKKKFCDQLSAILRSWPTRPMRLKAASGCRPSWNKR
jgi:hypothetical protein